MSRNRDTVLREIEARLGRIRRDVHDDESQHFSQDDLYRYALRAIAEGVDDPAAVAKAALDVDSIEFSRWYA